MPYVFTEKLKPTEKCKPKSAKCLVLSSLFTLCIVQWPVLVTLQHNQVAVRPVSLQRDGLFYFPFLSGFDVFLNE